MNRAGRASRSGRPKIRRISLQYFEARSFLHRIDPVSKLVWLLSVCVIAFVMNSSIPMLTLFAVVCLTAFLLGAISPSRFFRAGWYMLGVGLFFFLLQALNRPGQTVVVSSPSVTLEGINFGLATAFRILTIFFASLTFVMTTRARDLTLALIQILGLPYRLGYAFFLALRFIPTFENEAQTILDAHRVRGVGERAGLRGRLETYRKFLLPFLVQGIRKSEAVANAMDARAFGGSPTRTYLRRISLAPAGVLFATVWVVAAVFGVFAVYLLHWVEPIRP